MSISKRQFTLLKTMGIAVWQRRSLPVENPVKEQIETKVDLATLCSVQLFNDIMLFLDITAKDITVQSNEISLANFQWTFSADEDIKMQNNCLQTPALTKISTCTSLKRALWAELQQLGKK